MREAGLVTRDRPRQPVGRPRDEWSIAATARPGGEPPSGYEELGRWLALAINPSRKQLREIEAVGRQIGTDLVASSSTTPPTEVMQTTLSALGFQPRCQVGETVTYTLGNCPYRDAARENQPVICTLHRGITRGLLDTVAPESRLVEFAPRDPDAAGCLIEVDGLD
jgi:predicted ArsR family transcriptional regulator